MLRDTLSEIGLICRTDKGPRNHNYLRHYEEYFEPMRDKPIKLLEIGVFNGGSLRTWKAYFSNAQIYGIDCDHSCRKWEEDRVKIFIGAQSDTTFLQSVVDMTGPFDIIIDDGSHWATDQSASFDFLYSHLKPGGIYIVEDIHTSYWEGWGGSYVEYMKKHIDQVLYPCPSIMADHADRRNSPLWPQIQPKMTDFEKQTKSIHMYTGAIIYLKWREGEGY